VSPLKITLYILLNQNDLKILFCSEHIFLYILRYFYRFRGCLRDRLLTQDKFSVQQFTELYDKNKKPIYEGDRVRFGYTGNVDFFGEVIWLEDRASFGVRTGNAFETFEDLMDYMKYFEVVGNIFQLPCNPDHNGECLVCDCWLSDCQFLNKENNDKDV
jgi:hypothetical protein